MSNRYHNIRLLAKDSFTSEYKPDIIKKKSAEKNGTGEERVVVEQADGRVSEGESEEVGEDPMLGVLLRDRESESGENGENV